MNYKHPKMIVLFGPDGAGKTTQARRLVRYYRSIGLSSAYVWIRGRHTLAYILSTMLIRIGYYRAVRGTDGMSHRIFDPKLLPKLSRIWGIIELVSIIPWIFTKTSLPRLFGFTVIADRYTPDTLAYLAYWLGADFLKSLSARVLFSFIPRDASLIHLDAKVEVLNKRLKYDTTTKDFLLFQRRIYGGITKSLGAVTIDTSDSNISETFRRILAVLER